MPTPDRKHLGNDPELVTQAQSGDEDAFVALYQRHAPAAWNMGLGLTGRPADAGAVLTESFARTFTAIRAGRYEPGTTFRTLLLTSVRNAALDLRRDQAGDAGPAPGFEYAEDADARMIAAAFAPLPERWRTALWLTEVEGMRAKAVAPVVGLAGPATMTLVGRAHNGLSEQYLQLHVGQVNDRTCGRSVARLGSYVSGTLSAADADKLERHLRLCETCTDRHTQLRAVGQQLRTLILPLPAERIDDVRAAWTAVVATPATRTGTGLSPTAEKVLAGVSAVAAAVGIFGATMFGAAGGGGGDERAAAVAPAAAESSGPGEGDDPLAGVTSVALPAPDATGRTSSVGDSLGAAARQGSATSPTGDGVVGASGSGGAPTTATDIDGPTDPRTDGTGDTGGSTGSGGSTESTDSSEPALEVDTTVGDMPVKISVGADPGVTVGPISTDPAPDTQAPETQTDNSTVSVDGPLEPLAPLVEPIDEAITNVTSALGL